METDIKQFLLEVFDISPAEINLPSDCLQNLHAYIDAELDGRQPGLVFPKVAECLERDEEFRNAYYELRNLLAAERAGTLQEPPVEAVFDFSFLPHTAKTAIWQPAAEAVKVLGARLTILMEGVGSGFSELASGLVATALPIPAARDESPTHVPTTESLTVSDDEANTAIELVLGPSDDGRILTELSILVTRIEDTTHVPNARVTLFDEEENVLQSALTDGAGRATFANLEMGEYRVNIKMRQMVWQIPMTIDSADIDTTR